MAADLFAGAGGFSKAAAEAGIQVKVAVEIDPHACETYRRNLLSSENASVSLFEADLNKLSVVEIASPFGENGCDLVLGGPPCQGFSVHRIKGAGVSDPRNQLIHSYFEVVKYLQPGAFLMENVPGILWERHSQYLSLFYRKAEDAGYSVGEPVVLDARDFGVPQRRKRVFILGILSSMPEIKNWPPAPTHGNELARRSNPALKPWLAASCAFDPAPDGDINDIHMQHGEELIRAFANTPANGGSRRDSGRILTCHLEHDGHKDVYGRIDSSVPAPTMTTACINPSKGRFVHPTENHGITLRQAARLQTFPDSYTFYGGLIAAGRQIGNAVPVSLGRAVLEPVRAFLEEHM